MLGVVVGTQRTMERVLSRVCNAKERVQIWRLIVPVTYF